MRYAIALLAVVILAGCATPYSSNVTPSASADISDNGTSATLHMGAMGEFTLVATHSRTLDGVTTGSVVIEGRKATLGNIASGLIGLAAGAALP